MTPADRATRENCVLDHRDGEPRRAVDGLYICRGHTRELEQLVAEMPAKAGDLDRASGTGGPRPRGSHSEICVDDRAATHRAHMAGVVASWCRVVAEDHNITPPRSADLERTCPWLLPHLDWCAANRWVDEMLLELRGVSKRAVALTDLPARTVPLAAQCLAHRDGQRCDGYVTIVVRGDDWTARCSAAECEEMQDATPYLNGKGRVTIDGVQQMARLYGIPCSDEVVWQWKHRGKIKAERLGDTVWYDLASVTGYLSRRRAEHNRVA
jgi:hypothetical protein